MLSLDSYSKKDNHGKKASAFETWGRAKSNKTAQLSSLI